DLVALKLAKVIPQANEIIVVVETAQTKAVCPGCQTASIKLHSRYERRLTDLPWAGIAVRLHLRTRKFFCLNKDCHRRIFSSGCRRWLRLMDAAHFDSMRR